MCCVRTATPESILIYQARDVSGSPKVSPAPGSSDQSTEGFLLEASMQPLDLGGGSLDGERIEPRRFCWKTEEKTVGRGK